MPISIYPEQYTGKEPKYRNQNKQPFMWVKFKPILIKDR